MLDFLFALPVGDKPLPLVREPFQWWEAMTDQASKTRKARLGQAVLWMLGPDDRDLYQDAELRVLVHGQCYPRAGYDADGKGPLRAAEVARRYRLRGREFIRELKGSFNILVQEVRLNRMALFNDPVALRPLYYGRVAGGLLVSTSLRAILDYAAQSGTELAPDRQALLEHFLFDFMLTDRSYVSGIRELAPGMRLDLEGESFRLTPTFDPFSAFDLSGPEHGRKEGVDRLARRLQDAIDQQTEGPEHTAVALTGGFDSRCILSLLGKEARSYAFFSYGQEGSWDLDLPQRIAQRLDLNYAPIHIDSRYVQSYPRYAKMAVGLSEGKAEFTHANIPYVYDRHLRSKRSVLTGLFGSELIKSPTSRGLFLDANAIELLRAEDPGQALAHMLDRLQKGHGFAPAPEVREAVVEDLQNNPFVHNDLPLNRKYFHYLLRIGIRKYFQKEISLQRSWKTTLTPFLDMDFIHTLLRTPFPWVYHFSEKKNLYRNLAIHRVYAEIIHRDPRLSRVMSTHGYRPYNLLSPMRWPLLALEFYRNKGRSRKQSAFDHRGLAEDLVRRFLPDEMPGLGMLPWAEKKGTVAWSRETLKMASLQYWLRSTGLLSEGRPAKRPSTYRI